jgi:isopentenyl-diphosphate Delta-isomerase
MTPDQPWVILVDAHDKVIGHAEKIYAHTHNLMHRAFSIMLMDQNKPDHCLIQQRHASKYHCPNLWSNTCCSHPAPNEITLTAANRRLYEELGINSSLEQIGSFSYQVSWAKDLHENEYDHVFVGSICEKTILQLAPNEIQNTRWVNINSLYDDVRINPENYTPWLAMVLACVLGQR